jgi:hypothetical protein
LRAWPGFTTWCRARPHLRIARPSHDLRASERFWVDGLGLEVLFRAGSSAEGGHVLLMVGWSDAAWHLELVSDPGGETPAAPTEEDLLVLYLDGVVDAGVVSRLVDAGGAQVAAAIRTGITVASRSWTQTGTGWS